MNNESAFYMVALALATLDIFLYISILEAIGWLN
jgi:hypothetical protein